MTAIDVDLTLSASATPAACVCSSTRLRVFVDAYGLAGFDRLRSATLLGRRTRSMHDFLRDRAAQGAQPWARLWAEGHGDAWRNDAAYIEEREDQWTQALLAG